MPSAPTWVLWRSGDLPLAAGELEEPATFLTDAPLAPTSRSAPAAPPRHGRRPHSTRHPNLTRMGAGPKNRAGYVVRLQRAMAPRIKLFADAAHGDQLGDLAAALAWRDQMAAELGAAASATRGGARSNTGHQGITHTTKGGHPIFQATWHQGGRQVRRGFTIDRPGEQRALRAAMHARVQRTAPSRQR